MKLLASLLVLFTMSAANAADFCNRYNKHPLFINSVGVVAKNMNYTLEQLCNLPALSDIYVEATQIPNLEGKSIPHTWVTLHYAEHSCQYFVREEDMVVTKKNCYNTW